MNNGKHVHVIVKDRPPWSPVPLAVCEACSLVWMVFLVGGAVYLIVWQNWHWTTILGGILLMFTWSCKWCRVPDKKENT